MIYYQNETKQNMFNSYNNMTPVERSIADFFLSNTEKMDFSSKNISKRLYVSEAALSRFSKKCGYICKMIFRKRIWNRISVVLRRR